MSEKSHAAKLKLPPLNPLQLELRQICRQGDKDALKTFLANNPEINLDFKDPEGDSIVFSLNLSGVQILHEHVYRRFHPPD